MSLLKSVLFGSEGSYNIFGTKVEFQNEVPLYLNPPSIDHGLDRAGVITKLALKCVNSNPFRWIMQSYTHVFVHEVSHALACKVLIGQNSKVNIFTNLCCAVTTAPPEVSYASNWKRTVIATAGPFGDVAFATCKLVAATAFKSYLSWPVAFALGYGAANVLVAELVYAYVSASKRDHGDFGIIARMGNTHLALATTTLVSQVALGIFVAIKLAA